SITVNTGSKEDPAIATISYGEDGKLHFDGALELDAGTLTDGYVVGKLRVENGDSKKLSSKSLKFAKAPINEYAEEFAGDYDSGDKSFHATVTIATKLINKLLPDFIQLKEGITLTVARDSKGFSIEVKDHAVIQVSIGEYFTGVLTLN